MATTIKITALQDIGANLGNTSLFPVVDMAGTPTTEKVSMANVANFVLNYGPAAEATVAAKVSNNAQPNITSVGTLTNLAVTGNVVAGNVYANTNIIQGLLLGGTLIANSNAQPNITSLGTLVSLSVTGNVLGNNFSSNGNVVANNVTANTLLTVANITSNGTANLTTVNVSGNLSAGNANLGNAVTANFFIGDGGLLTNVAGGGSYSNNNVANYLPNYTGNINGDYLTLTHDANANVVYANYLYGDGSNITGVSATVAGTVTTAAQPNITSVGNLTGLVMSGNITPSANVTYNLGNNTNRWNNLYLSGNTIVLGDAILTANANALVVTTPAGGNFVLEGNSNTTFGNISSINIDGNASNILYGNGVFAASPNVALSGDGGNLSNINGANVNGTVANANLSQLLNVSDVSNNFSYHVVLSAGSGDKSLHIDADDNLQYNPNSGLLTAVRVDAQNFVGNLYYSNGYQVANVAGIGNIATINLNGNGSQVLAGNGTWVAQSGGGNASLPLANGSSNINIATANGNVTITANASNTWTFDNTGNLTAPGAINVGNMVIGTVAGDITADANTGVTFNVSGPDGGFAVNYLKEVGNGNTSGGELAFSSEIGNATYRISLSDDLGNGFATKIWRFDGTGNLVLAGGSSVIQSIANSSLDPTLPNVSTMTLTPDANYNSQVLVLDPTAPGHIHLRAYCFSNIDDPAANIFLGGEDTAFEITSGANNEARIHSNNYTWTFGNDGGLSFPRDAVGNTDPYLFMVGGPLPTITSVDVSLAGPANFQISSDYLNLTGYTGAKVAIKADNGEIATDANMVLTTNNANVGNTYSWTFDTAGNLTLPGNTFAVNYANGTQVSLNGLPAGSNNQIQFNSNGAFGASGNYTFTDTVGGGTVTVGNELNLLGNGTIGTSNNNLNIQPAGNLVVTASAYNWTFDIAGNLTLPGNTFAVNYANGSQASAPLVDITDTNGLTTVYYPTFVENRTTGQIVRADVDLSYRTDTNTLTVGNIVANNLGNISSINIDGNVSNVLTGNGTFVTLPVINANTVVWSTAPVANTSNGTAGQAAYDSGGNLYVCVATDTWAKFTGATSW